MNELDLTPGKYLAFILITLFFFWPMSYIDFTTIARL